MQIVKNPELDWDELVTFRREAAAHVKSKELWDWEYKYADAFFMMDGDIIVGQESIQPIVWNCKGSQHYHGLSFDSAVHPGYRGQGIFSKLVEHAVKECDYDLYYGFANANSIHGFERLGWQNMGQVKLIERLVNSISKNPTRFKEVTLFVEKPLHVENFNAYKEYGVDDLNYRYVFKPGNNYKIFGLDGKTEQFVVLNTFVDERKKVVQLMDSKITHEFIPDVTTVVNNFCLDNGCREYRMFSLEGTVEKQAWLIFYPKTNAHDVNMHFGDWDVT